MYHMVEYSDNPYHGGSSKDLSTQKEAVEFAERMMKRYRCIWLAEWAKFQTGSGKWVSGYVYYWWSQAVTTSDWGKCPDAGYGRPARRKYITPYRPLQFRSKSMAHLNERASPVHGVAGSSAA
jgi:hypothetical protein